MYLRENIDKELKKGSLKKEFSESPLLEIREYYLRIEKYKNDTIKKIDENFREIINVLKQRKADLIQFILDKFNTEKEKIEEKQELWLGKQDVTEKLLDLINDKDDKNILVNSKYIMNGIRHIRENLEFQSIQVYNDIDTSLIIDRKNNPIGMSKSNENDESFIDSTLVLSHEEVLHYLRTYMKVLEPNILEYKA